MTAPTNPSPVSEVKANDKELNFRMLEAKYEKQLAQERSARLEAEKEAQRLAQSHSKQEVEDDDSEPYVDNKKLNRTMGKFAQQNQSDIQKAMEMAKVAAKEELKQEMWLENNPDFYEVLGHAEKFAQRSPKLAETILRMPEGFERQKLVYQNIKEFGLHKPEEKKPSIQDTVDARRKGPYYQPSSVGTAPYASQADFSQAGQKQAHDKMQELKNRLRLG